METITKYVVLADGMPVRYAPYFDTKQEALDWISKTGDPDGWEGMRMEVEEVELDEEGDE